MNLATAIPLPTALPRLAPLQPGMVARVDWNALTAPEARRLRELGLDEGVEVELLKGSGIFGGPVACRATQSRWSRHGGCSWTAAISDRSGTWS